MQPLTQIMRHRRTVCSALRSDFRRHRLTFLPERTGRDGFSSARKIAVLRCYSSKVESSEHRRGALLQRPGRAILNYSTALRISPRRPCPSSNAVTRVSTPILWGRGLIESRFYPQFLKRLKSIFSTTTPGWYTYRPLRDNNTFRILEVRGSPDERFKVICCLVEVDWESHPPYSAISYTWEGQSPTHEIEVDGKPLMVTENCNAALRRFRSADADNVTRLWIDSVCIDQSEGAVQERNCQVAMMDRIYSEAATVLVSLHHSRMFENPRHRYVAQWIRDFAEIATIESESNRMGRYNDLIKVMDRFGA